MPESLDPDKYPYYSALRHDTDGRRYWRVIENSRAGARELKHTLPRFYHNADAEAVVFELTEAYRRGLKDG